MAKKKRTYRRFKSFRIDEISAVDRPAQEGARMIIMKRADDADEDIAKRARLLSSVNGHSHLLDDTDEGGTTTWQLSEGADTGHDHPWARLDDGSIKIGDAEGHSHTLITSEKRGPRPSAPTPEEKPMSKTPDTNAADLAKANDELSVVKAENANLQAMAEMTDAQKAYHSQLAGDDRAAYVAKSATERQADVEKAASDDAVIFTSKAGEAYRKSDDPRVVSMAKRLDEESELRKAAEAKADTQRIEKRAAGEFKNLPGEMAAKCALIKAVEGIEDEAVRKAAGEILKANNAAMAEAVKEHGTSASPVAKSATEEVEALVAKAREAVPAMTYEKAYTQVLEANPTLYEQIIS